LPKSSVFIVDDHEAIRRVLCRQFEDMPEFRVCGQAADGVQAVEKVQELTPDLIILDFSMPEMNGLETAAALRYMLPAAKIYLLTVHATRELELAARAAGVDAVFSKYQNLTKLFQQAKQDCSTPEGDDLHVNSSSQTPKAGSDSGGSEIY
jgi:DNA-binding NarL/FixJ family response regulator